MYGIISYYPIYDPLSHFISYTNRICLLTFFAVRSLRGVGGGFRQPEARSGAGLRRSSCLAGGLPCLFTSRLLRAVRRRRPTLPVRLLRSVILQ